MNGGKPLTFAALDGLAFAAERGRLDGRPADAALTAHGLGPLLEFIQLGVGGLFPRADMTAWLSLGALSAFEAAMRSGRSQWICPARAAIGFRRMSSSWTGGDAQWTGFGLAAQKAAIAAGFHPRIARQFLGALGEMASNIYEHSGAPASGVAAYRASGGSFEFVVADGGMGVLESLRTCPDYATLTDHGTALRFALTEGVSRFGPEAQRGNGFRPIFVGLANLSGSLRFRSGDHALVIDGQKIGAMPAKAAQKTRLRGFLASVACTAA